MATFPQRLRHSTGAYLDLDETRLLLAFREPVPVPDLVSRLADLRLVLEDAHDDAPDGRRMRRVNHTENRFWVRAADGEPLDDGRQAHIRAAFGDALHWIGPVYRLPGRESRESLLCPLPNVVLVKERRGGEPPITRVVARAAEGVQVTEDQQRSKYLTGFRYFVIDNPAEMDAYRLRDVLTEQMGDRVSDVQLETMPLVVPTAVVPNDTLFAQQWDMAQIQAPAGWDISTGAAGVVICVLDEGCDLTHPDLVFSGTGINLGSMSGDGSPTGPHGTACAGIAAATFNNNLGVSGVAGNCRILPAAVQNWTDVEVAAGINYAAANGARVISMSFGWNGWSAAIIDPAIQAAFAAGLVMCVATHNHDGAITYPATNPRVIAVGASDQVDSRKSPASPDGECWGSNFGPQISVVAPGVRIPTTDIQGAGGYNANGAGGSWACVNYGSFGDAAGDYVTVFDGTSAATPHVAGLAALLFSAYPTLTNGEVRTIIERTADKVGTVAYATVAGHDNGTWNQEMGYGRINVRRSLDLADVLIRDWPGDNGVEPSAPPGGNFWDFPDIVVRIFDDGVFVPEDPSQSKFLELGQTNYLYVRVRNNGPRDARNVVVSARVTPYVGTQFVYPTDWNAVDATHLSPTPVTASFASVPAGGEVIATFTISAAQVSVLHSNNWHPCLVASVTADNDYAFANAALTGSPIVVRRNNLAQRNLSVINVLAGAGAAFPFIAGHVANADRFMEIVVNRSALPRGVPVHLALDEDNKHFPLVDVDAGRDIPGGDEGLVFLERTRVLTRFGCCRGVLTLEKGSRLDCEGVRRVGEVTVTGGELVVRGGRRFVEIRDDVVVVRMEKAPGQLVPLLVTAQVPEATDRGARFPISVAQRDDNHEVVGGASVIFLTS